MEVTLIDSLGDDDRVASAARVSFHKEASNYSTEQNGKLIRYLADHNHFTPFTHCIITLREKVPIFVARQRFKHTVGFSYSETSRRYVDDEPEFYSTDVWRGRPTNSKQGSTDRVVNRKEDGNTQEYLDDLYKSMIYHAYTTYNEMIKVGVAPEQARMVLPQSLYTEYIVTGSLAAWARAYKLRSDSHSQKEIQDVAVRWDEIIRPLFPKAWSALVD